MYKLIFVGKARPALIDKILEQESYASLSEALKNKKITCKLLNIPSNQIEIEKLD